MLQNSLFKKSFALVIIVGFLNYIAHTFNLYWEVWWFDVLMHFLGGFWVGTFALYVLSIVYKSRQIDRKNVFIFVILSTLVVGVGWEIFEFYFDTNFFVNRTEAVIDTSSDLVLDLLGGFLAYKLYKKYLVK